MDADPHEVALWVLLKKTQSANKAVRLQAVQELADNHHWHGKIPSKFPITFNLIHNTWTSLVLNHICFDYSRLPVPDSSPGYRSAHSSGLGPNPSGRPAFFPSPTCTAWLGGGTRFYSLGYLPFECLPHTCAVCHYNVLMFSQGLSAEDGLRQLLASLPQSEVDKCVQYFTSLALRESTQSLAAQRVIITSLCLHVKPLGRWRSKTQNSRTTVTGICNNNKKKILIYIMSITLVLPLVSGWSVEFWWQWLALCPEPHLCSFWEGGVLLSAGTGTALKGDLIWRRWLATFENKLLIGFIVAIY